MTQQQFIEEIRRLSIAERIALMEAITRSLRDDLEPSQESVSVATPEVAQDETQGSRESRLAISQRLYGILKFDGEPPTDEELKDEYANYLTEKYS